MVNELTIVGYVGRDPELRHTSGGKEFATFSVATTDKSGGQEYTEWHAVTVWGKTCENVMKFVKKGMLVYVRGPIRSNERDGKRYVNLTGFTVKFLSRPKGESSAAPASDPAGAAGDVDPDDIPF